MRRKKYFNNRINVNKFLFTGIVKSYPSLKDADQIKTAIELITDPTDSSGKFHSLLSTLVFDKEFIRRFYFEILQRTQSFFKFELTRDQKIILERLNPSITPINFVSDIEARSHYFNLYENFQYTNKNHILVFSRALYLAAGLSSGTLKDCAQAVAFSKERKRIEKYSEAYSRELIIQKKILINLIFDYYPEETKEFLKLKSPYLIKDILRF